MTPTTTAQTVRAGVGRRVELARYSTTTGERVLYGQRISGVVRVTDHPASGHGRVYLVERELEHDGNAAMHALVDDYLCQAAIHDTVPMTHTPLEPIYQPID